ncbi:MAG: MMPL family transporter [Bacteroidales bacterium]|jgi:1-acyl-sn-glycerol-3-phosphate acyltransferase|nr:MMPL family transporter [Bacteroidales bacterium]
MSDLFIFIYRFFHKRRFIFSTLLLIFIAAVIFFAFRIRFEEDITQTMGRDGKTNLTGFAVKNLKLADKFVVDITRSDSLAKPDPEALIGLGHQFVDSLNAHFDTSFIRSIVFQTSDTLMMSLRELVIRHLPSFYDEADYAQMDSLLSPVSVGKSIEKNFKILTTPAGMALRKQIQQDPLGFSNIALNKLRSLQVDGNYEIYDGCVFSKDLRHLLLFVVPSNPSNETSRNTRLVNGMDKIINTLCSGDHSGFEIGYFGSMPVAVSNAVQLKKDITLTLAIAIVLIFLLIGWYFRSLLVPLLGLLPALFGGGLSLAVLSITKGAISAISLGIGSVILGLIVDYTLYMVNMYRRKSEMEALLKEMSLTIVLCSLTTAGAFLCLIFLNSGVLHDLGWFAAISVLGAAFFALIILPHFLSFIDGKKPFRTNYNLVDRLAAFRFDKSVPLMVFLGVVLIVSLFFANRVAFEKNIASLSFITPRLAKTESTLNKIGDYKLKNIYLVSTGPSIEKALQNKERMEVFVQSMQNKGMISGSSGAGPLLQSDSLQQLKINRWNAFWTTERKQQLHSTILDASKRNAFKADAFDAFFDLLGHSFQPLPANDEALMNNPMIAGWLTITPQKILAPVILKVNEENIPAVYKTLPVQSDVALFDKQSLTLQFVENVKLDFDLLVKLSMIFVTMLLVISFGRLGLGLITAMPMYLSWLITLGFMGLTGIRFNIFNIIISSFIFGLGVDYSILMMRGLQQFYKTGIADLTGYKVSVILSSITTLFGVGALFFARHPALNSIALISIIGIILVVVLSFMVLPLLFDGLILSRKRKSKFPVTLRIVIKTFITWGNIVLIAFIMMVIGVLINLFLPVRRKKKELIFHHLFSRLTKAYIAFTFAFDRKLINEPGEDFTRPAIIISNHQSLIETPAFLRLSPKILILTTTWVYKSPIFGPIAKLAGYVNADSGIENILEPLRTKIKEGYSILIFPEGHRSTDQKIQRFHRGAFYLAEKLQIDILPIMVFGTGDFLEKGSFWGRPNSFRMKILPRVACDDTSFGTTYQEKARQFRQFYYTRYAAFKAEEGNAHYYRRKLALNYVLKGPILEWYMRTKLKLEDDYEIYNRIMPRQGQILDLGCGYGFISYMLMFTSDTRSITGIDYDTGKISVAANCYSKNDRIRFFCADVSDYAITPHNGFLLSDILHYLAFEKQESLLRKCFSNLIPGGTVLIREANSELKHRHKKSVMTELFSTRTGFNKIQNTDRELYFTSAEKIRQIAGDYGMQMEVIDNKKVTSNNLFIIRYA